MHTEIFLDYQANTAIVLLGRKDRERKSFLNFQKHWYWVSQNQVSFKIKSRLKQSTRNVLRNSCSLNFFQSEFSFMDIDDSQVNMGKEGTVIIPLYHFHLEIQTFHRFWAFLLIVKLYQIVEVSWSFSDAFTMLSVADLKIVAFLSNCYSRITFSLFWKITTKHLWWGWIFREFATLTLLKTAGDFLQTCLKERALLHSAWKYFSALFTLFYKFAGEKMFARVFNKNGYSTSFGEMQYSQ